MDGTVLVADDDRTIRTVLTQALTRAGCKVHATSSLTTLMRWVGEGMGDVVITDVSMPDGNGLEMVPRIAADRPGMPVIIISAQNSIMTAIRATEAQAYDYLPKPFDLPDLMKRTARALEGRRAAARPDRAPASADREDLPLVGRTPAMQEIYRLVARVLHMDLPVLIRGECGTGKSLIARAIHDFSERRSLPFVVVTESDLPDAEAVERAIARSRGGTLMIEEPGDLPVPAQALLSRAMDRADDHAPRFLATCQADPALAMQAGGLRQDLYYRLSGVTLHVPALRDRTEDIGLLAAHFLKSTEVGTAIPRNLSDGALRALANCSWPGNVRQLENTMRQLALTGRAAAISQAEVEQVLNAQPGPDPARGSPDTERLGASVERHLQRYFDLHGAMLPPAGLYSRILREVEVPMIEIALAATAGNQAKCADLLGINRNTLRKKITDLDIEVTRGRKMM